MMTNLVFNARELSELIFGLVLVIAGFWLAARHSTHLVQQYRHVGSLAERARHAIEMQRAAREACAHPAWRVERLAYAGDGQALKISCFRCGVPALDRFESRALSDGTIAIVNTTPVMQLVVIAGELHEMLPPSDWNAYEDDAHESTYAVFLQPPESTSPAYLRKL